MLHFRLILLTCLPLLANVSSVWAQEHVVPENLLCEFTTDCQWASGWPQEAGTCGCYSRGYTAVVRQNLKDGIYRSSERVFCEPPPYPETACVCVNRACQFDAPPFERAHALEAARQYCADKGYEWQNVQLVDEGPVFIVKVMSGGTVLEVDKSTREAREVQKTSSRHSPGVGR